MRPPPSTIAKILIATAVSLSSICLTIKFKAISSFYALCCTFLKHTLTTNIFITVVLCTTTKILIEIRGYFFYTPTHSIIAEFTLHTEVFTDITLLLDILISHQVWSGKNCIVEFLSGIVYSQYLDFSDCLQYQQEIEESRKAPKVHNDLW